MVRSDGLRWRLGVRRSAVEAHWWAMVRSGRALMGARRASQRSGGVLRSARVVLMGDHVLWTGSDGG